MKLAIIGFGNAGGKIADTLLEYEFETGRSLCRSVFAVNTAQVDLARLEHVPEDNRVLIGQTDARSKGHGVGGDPDLGAEVAEQDRYELERALDEVPIHEIDAFLVIAGLGGGTGSGGGPIFAEKVREIYDEPVYGLGILPSAEEGGRASLNAARSFPTFVGAVDNLLVFDNDTWRQSAASVEETYEHTNREIAKRVVTLLSAGEIDGSQVSENAMDSSDIRRTLDTGGVSVIAYAESELEETTGPQGLLDRLRATPREPENGADAATKVNSIIRKAVRSRLTCRAEVESAERSLIVVSGPPEEFSRKGLETGRQWLEQVTGSVEVLAGDDPRRSADSLSAAVLLSNVTDVPRIDQLQEQAVAAQENIVDQESTREDDIETLITDDYGELDPVGGRE